MQYHIYYITLYNFTQFRTTLYNFAKFSKNLYYNPIHPLIVSVQYPSQTALFCKLCIILHNFAHLCIILHKFAPICILLHKFIKQIRIIWHNLAQFCTTQWSVDSLPRSPSCGSPATLLPSTLSSQFTQYHAHHHHHHHHRCRHDCHCPRHHQHPHHEQLVIVWEGLNSARLAIFYNQQLPDSSLLSETMTMILMMMIMIIMMVLARVIMTVTH